MREGILGNFQAGIKGTLEDGVIVYKPYGWDESKPYLYFNASTHQWVTIYPPVEDTDEQLLEFTMLWIECSDGTLINMNRVNKIYIEYWMTGGKGNPSGDWIMLDIDDNKDGVKVAHGTIESCKQMLNRIQTYFMNHNEYADRNIIRHAWLTHKLP